MSAQLVAVLVLAAAWLAIGAAGLAALHRLHLVARWLFPAGGAVALLIAAAALPALWGAPQAVVLPIGLPGAPFHFRLDGLSAFFLIVLGGAAAGVSLFSAGYFRSREGTAPGLLCLQYHVFLAAMALVILADDAYAFMVMWETMALASFFLVITNHRLPEIRRAAYLYLLIAHIGALAILLCFGVLQANTGDTSFAAMRAQTPTPFWASVAFLLALAGFYPAGRYLVPPESGESAAAAVTLPFGPEELAANSGQIFKFGNRAGILVKTPAGELRAFSAQCSHLGCIVQYRDDLSRIWCACHNGHFDLNGAAVQGPPPGPLERYEVNVRDDQIVVTKGA